jgi:dienelactone hydrolase
MVSVREEIREFIGLTPPVEPAAADAIERVEGDGYTRTHLQFTATDGDRIGAFLFEPIAAPARSGALVLHQHNSEWSLGKSEVAGLAGDPLQAFGPALSRQGIAVLAADAIGFESRCGTSAGPSSLAPPMTKRGSSAEGWLQYYNHMAHRLVRGDLLMRKMLQDAQAGVAVLQRSLPDGAPVGVVGHSMGGGVALFLGALDTRIAFVCASGAACSYRERLARGLGLEMALVIPGFASRFDLDDVMRCVAPRGLFIVSADDDPATVDAAALVTSVQSQWASVGARRRLSYLRVSGGHALDRQRFDAIVDRVRSECGDA